jgi:hypothetical protein
MKNTLRTVVMAAIAVTAIAVGTASAQAASLIKVPFDFKVGNQICPAGDYVVTPGFNHNLVVLKSKDAKYGFSWLLAPGNEAPGASGVTLKFDEVGGSEFLHSVTYGWQTTPTIDRGNKFLERPISHTIQGQ